MRKFIKWLRTCRIVKNEYPDGRTTYTIEQRHLLFWWWWCDAWVNSWNSSTISTFNTEQEAIEHVTYFDGSYKSKDTIIA